VSARALSLPLLVVVVWALASRATEPGAPVIVVSDQSVFKEAAAGARRALPDARVVPAEDLAATGAGDASVVVAIGPLAVRAVSRLGAEFSHPVVACLAPSGRGLPSDATLLPLYPSTREVLSTVKEIVPRAKRVALFRSANHAFAKGEADALGFLVVEPEGGVALTTAIDRALSATDLVWIPDPSAFSRDPVALEYLVKSAVARGVPVVGANRAMVERGALFALVPDPTRVGAAAGVVADALRRGAATPEIPPTTQILVGERALKSYALTIPSKLEPRVDRVK